MDKIIRMLEVESEMRCGRRVQVMNESQKSNACLIHL